MLNLPKFNVILKEENEQLNHFIDKVEGFENKTIKGKDELE